MLTPFGKAIRKLRIDKMQGLGDLAGDIGVSAAYLSAVETGKKNPTPELVEEIVKYYQLDNRTKESLHELAACSKTLVKLPLNGVTDFQRDLAVSFARRFDSVDESTSKAILELLKKGDK